MPYHFELSSDYFDCTVPNLENNDRGNHIIRGGEQLYLGNEFPTVLVVCTRKFISIIR